MRVGHKSDEKNEWGVDWVVFKKIVGQALLFSNAALSHLLDRNNKCNTTKNIRKEKKSQFQVPFILL